MKEIKHVVLLLVFIVSFIIVGCSGSNTIIKEYSNNTEEVYDACILTIRQMSGNIKVADKKNKMIMFSAHEPWATYSPNEISIDLIELDENRTRLIATVNNPSIQLIDWKTKERALMDFNEKLLMNLQK